MGLLDKVSVWLGGARVRATVLLLGLDNSGKSSLLRALRAQEQRAASAPDRDLFTSGGVLFEARDVPGAARLRALWERHFARAHAIIFVVDAADHLRLVVAREELQLALAHPELRARRLPLLVLANKCDSPQALSATHVAAGKLPTEGSCRLRTLTKDVYTDIKRAPKRALGLERIKDKPWHVCSSSAVSGAGLADGVSWLARQLRDSALQKCNH